MANMNAMAIAVAEARSAIQDKTTLKDRLEGAMEAVKDHWMVYDDDERFRCAVGAVILESPPEEADRVRTELQALQQFSAALAAAQHGIGVDFSTIAEIKEPVGLMAAWRKVKDHA